MVHTVDTVPSQTSQCQSESEEPTVLNQLYFKYTMQHFESVFEHWAKFRVIYCKTCRFCPVPNQVTRHLKEHHSHVAPEIRQQIAQVVAGIEVVARQPSEVRYPDGEIEPIIGLPVMRAMFQCTGQQEEGVRCMFMCQHVETIQKHCKKQHGWVNIQKRGGNTFRQQQTPNRMWIDQCQGQQFFRVDRWKRYFPVVSPHIARTQVDEIVLRAERQLAKQKQAIEEFQRHKEIGAEENRYVANAWLERAGWKAHLAAYTQEELKGFVAIPQNQSPNEGDQQPSAGDKDEEGGFDEREPALWQACQSTIRVIHAAQKASHPNIVGIHALQFVNRRETGQKNNEKPFYGRQMGKTIRKYRKHWVRILCYIWRTYDDVDPKPAYRLTVQQSRRLHSLRDAVRHVEQGAAHWRKVDEACLAWWIALLDHQLEDHQYHSAMISSAAVLG